jgi:O-methyltransferase
LKLLRAAVRRGAAALGFDLERTSNIAFKGDGMTLRGKHAPFLQDQRFMSAYRRGVTSGHRLGASGEQDIHIEWRVAVTCWAARHGAKLPGDFVECGVNTGIYSLAICEYLNFNSLNKSFYLFDTFKGIPEEQMSASERSARISHNKAYYEDCFDIARRNFAPFPSAKLIRGNVPDTLPDAKIDKVCYLSIDMNIAWPERQAIEYFWPKLSQGAFVVLDDYGFHGYEEQMRSMNEFAQGVGVEVLALPTGQGLIVKP